MSSQPGRIVGIAIAWAAFMAISPRVCAATPAETPAREPPATDVNAPRETWRWYGWQTFAADAVAGAIFLGAFADEHNSALFGVSGVTFGLGAPAIHVAHGRWAIALGSFGLRILGPFVGAMIGAGADVRASQDGTSEGTHGKWVAIGAALGALPVSAIDGVLLAHDPELSRPVPANHRASQPSSLPQLVFLRNGVGLAYSGQF